MPFPAGFLALASAVEDPTAIRLKVNATALHDSIVYTPRVFPPDLLETARPFFDDMPYDPYLETVYRTRRFGKYLIRDLDVEGPHPIALEYKGNVFIQTGEYNDLVKRGEMALVRKYEEHVPGFLESDAAQAVLQHAVKRMVEMGAPTGVPFEVQKRAVTRVRTTVPSPFPAAALCLLPCSWACIPCGSRRLET